MRFFAILFSFSFLLIKANAQTWEIGINAGGANYLGDLAPSLVPCETGLNFGTFIKKNYSGYFSLTGALQFGRIAGDDQNFKFNSPRNLQFRTSIAEASFTYEFNFQKYMIGLRAKKFSPYVFTGLAFSFFVPQAQINGNWFNLRAMSTEGQGLDGNGKYQNFTFAIPMGGGFKLQIADRLNTATFAAYRFTFSDHLDDVGGVYYDNQKIIDAKGPNAGYLADPSTNKKPAGMERGNQNNNDWYMFVGISISYLLNDPNCPDPAGNRRR